MSTVKIAGMNFDIEIVRRRQEPPDAPRLIIVCFNTTTEGVDITRVCVDSISKHTPDDYELWVVDNCSPLEHRMWLQHLDGVNAVLNNTPPIPPQNQGLRARLGLRRVQSQEQMSVGSFANAVGLELGVHAIDSSTQQVMVLHNDVLALEDHWLDYLRSKLDERIRAVGVRADESPRRIGALHVSGLLFDHVLFRQMKMTFMPDLPRLDVGDRISESLWEAGYETFVGRNSHNEPELHSWIDPDSTLAKLPYVTVTFDDDHHAIFAHLGRGTPKAVGSYWKDDRTMPDQWIRFARDVVLA